MTGKERAALRAEAHHLRALVHVGHQGVTDAIRAALDDALRTHELVKIQLAKALDAEVVQVIGRTTTLYRENPELPHKAGTPPAWSE